MQLMKKEARESLRAERWRRVKDGSQCTVLQDQSVILFNSSTLHIPSVSLGPSRLDLEEGKTFLQPPPLTQSSDADLLPTMLHYFPSNSCCLHSI